MGRHKEWRKIAKRERRRKIRTLSAMGRDNPFVPESSEYESWINEQKMLEIFELDQIEKQNDIENEKWLKAEKIAIKNWQELQKKLEAIRQTEMEQKERKRLEYEQEQVRVKEAKEKIKKIQEENERKQKIFMERLESFLNGGSESPPPELLVSEETKPGCEPCPFFSKTACCRFGDQCSRNHEHCGISKTLLAVNFFTHFGLENSNFNEYDTDLMLEYEDTDTYRDFKEFYYDVVPEFEKFGKVVQFKVCNNYERHLRGNVFVQFAALRGALAAWRALHARWYAGRQLTLRFVHLPDWKNAICGLQSSRRCPKGRSCNFLHVFKNPDRQFDTYFSEKNDRSEHRRSWRWSESPEVEIREKKRSKDRARSRRDHSRNRSRERKHSRGTDSAREHSSRSGSRRHRRRRDSRDSDDE